MITTVDLFAGAGGLSLGLRESGHGYEPVFAPLSSPLTYAEMERAQKHAASHRARAMAQLSRACLP